MPKASCRRCKTEKVSAPRFGTFVGDSKNFRKTALGQRELSLQTPEPTSSKETASTSDQLSTDDHPDES